MHVNEYPSPSNLCHGENHSHQQNTRTNYTKIIKKEKKEAFTASYENQRGEEHGCECPTLF